MAKVTPVLSCYRGLICGTGTTPQVCLCSTTERYGFLKLFKRKIPVWGVVVAEPDMSYPFFDTDYYWHVAYYSKELKDAQEYLDSLLGGDH